MPSAPPPAPPDAPRTIAPRTYCHNHSTERRFHLDWSPPETAPNAAYHAPSEPLSRLPFCLDWCIKFAAAFERRVGPRSHFFFRGEMSGGLDEELEAKLRRLAETRGSICWPSRWPVRLARPLLRLVHRPRRRRCHASLTASWCRVRPRFSSTPTNRSRAATPSRCPPLASIASCTARRLRTLRRGDRQGAHAADVSRRQAVTGKLAGGRTAR